MRKILTAVAVLFLASGVAFAQGRGASFPTQEELKTKVGFDEEQLKKSEPIVTKYTADLKEASDKVKDAADKKAAYGEVRTIRTAGMEELKKICKDDEQKTKLAEAFPDKKKKNQN